jgi:hypothetical protein
MVNSDTIARAKRGRSKVFDEIFRQVSLLYKSADMTKILGIALHIFSRRINGGRYEYCKNISWPKPDNLDFELDKEQIDRISLKIILNNVYMGELMISKIIAFISVLLGLAVTGCGMFKLIRDVPVDSYTSSDFMLLGLGLLLVSSLASESGK